MIHAEWPYQPTAEAKTIYIDFVVSLADRLGRLDRGTRHLDTRRINDFLPKLPYHLCQPHQLPLQQQGRNNIGQDCQAVNGAATNASTAAFVHSPYNSR